MAIFTVTTLVDELNTGDTIEELSAATGLSLREAVELANANDGADRIEFADGLSGLVRLDFDADPAPPYTNQLFITDEVTIDGGGQITITGDAQNNDITTSGDITTLADNGTAQLLDNSRVFFVRDNADTTLIGLTLTGGRARNDNGHGGVIYSQSDLTIIDSQITGNSTSGDNAKGGGVFSRTDITLIDSEIRDNSTSGERSYGGGVAAEGTLTITRSEVSKNFTVGRFSDGGAAYAGGDLVVSTSTISGNGVSGNFAASGGGLATSGGLTLTNSTVAYNQVDSYRGYGGGIKVEGDATISHSTIVGNSVSDPPAFAQRNAGSSVAFEAGLTVNNSIIVGNIGPTADEPELGAYLPYREYELTFTGLNIIGASAEQFDASALDNVINADPSVVFEGDGYRLELNSGSVRTIALSAAPDNPALDAATGDDVEDADARGVAASGGRDLGAYELITDASLVVTTGDDVLDATDGVLSLREAVYLANDAQAANTITFAPEVEGTIRLTEGEILIFDDLTVDGGGRITITGDADGNDVTDADGITDVAASSDAGVLGDNSRIFYSVGQDYTLIIDGLTLTGGYVSTARYGGGAVRTNGDLSVLSSTISGNSTAASSAKGGGLHSKGSLTVLSSTISDNSTAADASSGGGLFSSGAIVITSSAIYGNSTTGSASFGGGIAGSNNVTVTNSTIADNSTTGSSSHGGGIASAVISSGTSGSISLAGVTLSLTNSTITGNSVAGEFAQGGGIYSSRNVSVTDSIILGNVALNSSYDELLEVTGSLQDSDKLIEITGQNIIGADSLGFDAATKSTGSGATQNASAAQVFNATTDNHGVAAGGLADNGGPVQTIALKADRDNPALDATNSAAKDARGLPRVDLDFIDNGGVADLGAFELQDQILFAPSFTSSGAFSVAENQTAVGNVTASDDTSGVLFAITGGADAALFAINAVTGALSFSTPPDFEAPSDANGDNVFSLEVRVTDSDDIAVEQSLTVTVIDLAEADGSGPTNPAGGPTNGDDMLVGTAGTDVINALAGDDTVHSLAGNDLIIGGAGNDSIKGAAGDDSLRGNRGEDTLKGGGGDDNIKGNGGEDVISGNGGADVIRAGGGADNVKGGGGADLILGGGGADRLNGGGGADTLKGNGGDDILRGNGGADVFQFRTNDRNDTILDFRQGQDKIQIQNGARSFEALSIEQDGRDVLIGFGVTGQIRVVTDNAAAFDQDDFIF